MERNYDEIIAEMLMQIDRHTEELNKHSLELSKHSKQLDLSAKVNAATLKKLQDMEKIDNSLLQQLVHSATILDRIIKKNDLRV